MVARQAEIPLPRPLASLSLDDGVYYKTYSDCQLKLVAVVNHGKLGGWLLLREREACYYAAGSYWVAEKYYPDGRMEDFARDDDTSPPYKAPISFPKWVRSRVDQLLPSPAPVEIPARLRSAMEFMAQSKHDLPPHPERILSTDGTPPDNLAELVEKINDMPWSHLHQCQERLVNYLHCDPGLARDFCNFAPEACAAVVDESVDPQGNVFFFPVWEPGPSEAGAGSPAGRASLEGVPLYRRVRELAQMAEQRGGLDRKHWTRILAALAPRVLPEAGCEAKRPRPIVWTNPPHGLSGFSMTMAAMDTYLRQEASRETRLFRYLQSVDRQRFLRAAAVVGAFLQATRCTGTLELRCPDLQDLIAALDEGPCLAGKSTVPILAALGEWVHRQCSEAPVRKEDELVVHLLGHFINHRGDELARRFQAFSSERVYFEATWPDGWEAQHPGDWNKPLDMMRGALRQRATDLAEQLQLTQQLASFSLNAFLLRVEVAGTTIYRGQQDAFPQARHLATELKCYLEAHPALETDWVAWLSQKVGAPVTAGPSYTRLVTSARWVLSPWTPESASRGVALAHGIISAF